MPNSYLNRRLNNSNLYKRYVLDYTSPTWNTQSFSFDATNNLFTGDSTASTIINNAIAGANKQFTIAIWVKKNSSPAAAQFIFCRDKSSATSARQFTINFTNAEKFQARFFTNSTNDISYVSTASITETREWNQFVIVYDYTQAVTSRITVYRNGILLPGTTTQTGVFSNVNNISSPNINIGGRADAAAFSNIKIGQISVFNTNLSAANVALLHNDRVPFDVRTNSTLNANLVLLLNPNQSSSFSTNWTWTDLVGSSVFTSSGMVLADKVDDAPALKQVSVVMLAGQSNGSGRQTKSTLASRFQGLLNWLKFWNTNTMENSDSSTDNNQYYDTSANSEYGIEYYLAERLNRRYKKTIYIFKVAQGGSYLANNSPSWSRNPQGAVFIQFSTDLTNLKEWELSNGYTITKIRFIWIQGEADSLTLVDANAYETSWTNWLVGTANSVFDTKIKAAFYVMPKLYDCLLSANQTDPDMVYKATINTAKTNVQATDTTNYRIVNTDLATVGTDLAHYNDNGYNVISEAIDNLIAIDGF